MRLLRRIRAHDRAPIDPQPLTAARARSKASRPSRATQGDAGNSLAGSSGRSRMSGERRAFRYVACLVDCRARRGLTAFRMPTLGATADAGAGAGSTLRSGRAETGGHPQAPRRPAPGQSPPHPTSMALRDDVPHALRRRRRAAAHSRHRLAPTRRAPKRAGAAARDEPRRAHRAASRSAPSPSARRRTTTSVPLRDRRARRVADGLRRDRPGDASPHVPLRRPHPELNPFAPPDRIAFCAARRVGRVRGARLADSRRRPINRRPSTITPGSSATRTRTPHPDAGAFVDLGRVLPRRSGARIIEPNGTLASFPVRLRGVFAFATLSNGSSSTIDVDDWDAPCRRPDPMASGPSQRRGQTPVRRAFGQTGVLALPQPPRGPRGRPRPVSHAVRVQLRIPGARRGDPRAVLPGLGRRTALRSRCSSSQRPDGRHSYALRAAPPALIRRQRRLMLDYRRQRHRAHAPPDDVAPRLARSTRTS